MNLQGSHQCLEVLVLQNYQENPEKRRQTWMSVIEAPWCRQSVTNRSPGTLCSTLESSGTQGRVGQPACLSSSKPFLPHQHSSTRPKPLIHKPHCSDYIKKWSVNLNYLVLSTNRIIWTAPSSLRIAGQHKACWSPCRCLMELIGDAWWIHSLSACQKNKHFQTHYSPHPRAVKGHVYYMKKSPQKTTSSHYIQYKSGRLQTIIEKGVEVLSQSQNMVVWHVLSHSWTDPVLL